MFNYCMQISYDGLTFNGWQRLKNNQNTIQGLIEATLSKILEENIKITGSGRTDAGVSAYNQYANFKTKTNILKNFPSKNQLEYFEEFIAVINKSLPESIKIKKIFEVNINFNSRKDAIKKTYEYYISLSSRTDVFLRKHIYLPMDPPLNCSIKKLDNITILSENICKSINSYNSYSSYEIDIKRMETAAKFLCGTHDFSSFTTDKTPEKSHIRTIESISFNIKTTDSGNNILVMSFTGNGFLYNMVRILSGTLYLTGIGKIQPTDIPLILKSKNREAAGPTLPPYALFLKEVYYDFIKL